MVQHCTYLFSYALFKEMFKLACFLVSLLPPDTKHIHYKTFCQTVTPYRFTPFFFTVLAKINVPLLSLNKSMTCKLLIRRVCKVDAYLFGFGKICTLFLNGDPHRFQYLFSLFRKFHISSSLTAQRIQPQRHRGEMVSCAVMFCFFS